VLTDETSKDPCYIVLLIKHAPKVVPCISETPCFITFMTLPLLLIKAEREF
jgi:hypothetical protein